MKRPMHKDDANRRRVYVGHGGGGRIWNFDPRYSSQRPLFRGRVCMSNIYRNARKEVP